MMLRNVLTGEVKEGLVADGMNVPVLESPEKSDCDDTMTEQSYIPPEQLISDMEKAGRFLNEVRRARFSPEFDSDLGYQDDEDIALDPGRNPGADLVDIARVAHATGLRLREQDKKDREARQAARDAEAAKATSDEVERLVQERLKAATVHSP